MILISNAIPEIIINLTNVFNMLPSSLNNLYEDIKNPHTVNSIFAVSDSEYTILKQLRKNPVITFIRVAMPESIEVLIKFIYYKTDILLKFIIIYYFYNFFNFYLS